MGQYFKLINYDKQQRYNPSDTTFAIKWYGFTRDFANSVATIDLLTHDWEGDRVAIIGDYENEQDYLDDDFQDISGDHIRKIVERNINVSFEKSQHGWYSLPESCNATYIGNDTNDEYVFVNYDKHEFMRFDGFDMQGNTYQDIINTSYTTGAYFTICHLLSSNFSYGNSYDSWSGNKVGIITINDTMLSFMNDITKDVLQEPDISEFYLDDDAWI